MKTLALKTRTYRKFKENERLGDDFLQSLVELARLGGSAQNGQPWQYQIINEEQLCGNVFPFLGWAGYLKDWKGPAPGQRPAAYILCWLNTTWQKGAEIHAQFDLGIASQNILLGAMAHGVGGCRIGAFNPKLADLFNAPEELQLKLVIALGKPDEEVVLEKMENGDVKYWRDSKEIHHVPKRSLEEVVITLDEK